MLKNNLLLFAFSVLLMSCQSGSDNDNDTRNYRQDMRNFVQDLSSWAKSEQPGFIVIPQNGQELVTEDGEEEGTPVDDYLAAIDGAGREDLYFGYTHDDEATPTVDMEYMRAFLRICENHDVEALVTDYCSTHSHMDSSYAYNALEGFTSFAAPDRELRSIPDYPSVPWNSSGVPVTGLAGCRNFLYLLNSEQFTTRSEFITTLASTDYDLFIIDAEWEGDPWTPAEIATLQHKPGGARRLVISYLSIGEAEDYRAYWQSSWTRNPPDWLAGENPDWEGNYKVRYWNEEWQAIIYGTAESRLGLILASGFDGVYLDIIDAFEYFENGEN